MTDILRSSSIPHCENCGAHFYGKDVEDIQKHVRELDRKLKKHFNKPDKVFISMIDILELGVSCCDNPNLYYSYWKEWHANK